MRDHPSALDNNIYIPLPTARSRFGETPIRRSAGSFEAERVELHQITVALENSENVEMANLQIEAILQRFHRKKDYEVSVPLQLLTSPHWPIATRHAVRKAV